VGDDTRDACDANFTFFPYKRDIGKKPKNGDLFIGALKDWLEIEFSGGLPELGRGLCSKPVRSNGEVII